VYVYTLCQGGNVFISISLLVSRIMQKLLTNFHKIPQKGGIWALEETTSLVIRITLCYWS